ncbi:MAG: C25 family cysteine peptidase [Vicinamibacterales bacterium]
MFQGARRRTELRVRLADSCVAARALLSLIIVVCVPQVLAAQILSGSYTGDGVDNRSITGLGFQPDVLIIKGDNTQIGVIRTSTMTGDNAKPMTGGTALTANLIQSLDPAGFTIGNDARVNSNGIEYYWIAFKQGSKRLEVGSYTGNGGNPRTVSGLGFSPDFLVVVSAGAAEAVWRSTADTESFNFSTSAGSFAWITALGATSFTITNDARVNANGTTYHYIAWNEVPGVMEVGTYTGDGLNNRNITGLGFEPEYVLVKQDGTQEAVQHPASIGRSVDDTLFFLGAASLADRIQQLNGDGFQLGTNTDVNASGVGYQYIAWRRVVAQTEVLTGSYVGDGADNRSISGLGFTPDAVIVKGDTTQNAVLRTYSFVSDYAKDVIDGTIAADRIQSFDADGFTVGTDARVNSTGVTYHWIAWIGGAGEMTVGTYTGNGTAGRNITDLGFSPDFVIVLGTTAEAVYRNSAATASFNFDATRSTAWISAMGADGFTVGSDTRVNGAGGQYGFVAWNEIAGQMDVGTYTGDGADDRSIAGVGFQPEYAFVQRDTTGYNALHHPNSLGATTDLTLFFDNRGAFANYIQALESDGFQVGDQSNINQSGAPYVYAAWKRPTLTAVRMSTTSAARTERGVTVRWRTGYEVDNLGFEIYREQGGERTRVTTKPIAGSALMVPAGVAMTAGHSYTWTDESEAAREPGVVYWIQDIDLNGTRSWHGPIVPDQEKQSTGARKSPDQPRDAAPPRETSEPVTTLAAPDVSAVSEVNSPLLQELITARSEVQPDGRERSQVTIPGPVYSGFWPVVPANVTSKALSATTKRPAQVTTVPTTAPAIRESQVATLVSQVGSAVQPLAGSVTGSASVTASSPSTSGSLTVPGISSLPPQTTASNPQSLPLEPPGPPAPPAAVRARTTVISGAQQPPQSADVQQQWSIAAQSSVRVDIRSAGLYRLTHAVLTASGIDPAVDPRNLRLIVDGVEHPMIVNGQSDGVFDPSDSVEFYADGVDTPFTDRRPYWITAGTSAGLRLSSVDARNSGSPAGSSFAHTVERKDRVVFFGGLQNGDAENFFGPLIMGADAPDVPVPTEQQLTLAHVADLPAASATLEIALQGVTARPLADDHRVGVLLNGTELGELVFDGRTAIVATFDVAHALLVEGTNTVAFEARVGIDDMSLIRSVRLVYQRKYIADGNQLTLEADPGQELVISGFSNDAVHVFDVTGDAASQELLASAALESGSWTVHFTVPAGVRRKLFLTTADAIGTPAGVYANVPSTLHNAGQSGDVVMITDPSFTTALAPLKNLRESQGYSVRVIDIQDLYDEFSFGQKRPDAIRAFLMRAAKTWTKPPKFVLLVGNATTDPRDYQGVGEIDFVPTRIVSTSVLETASDDWFVDSDDDGFADLGSIGRLPARSAVDVDTMVAKIVAYEQSPSESWHQSVLLVSDQGDADVEEFASLNDAVGGLVPAGYQLSHLKRAEDPDAAQTLRTRLSEGQVLVNYQGHGSVEVWRGDLLTTLDVPALANGSRLPFVVSMTCFAGFFQGVYPEESLAEALVRAPNGGAVGVWASSGMTDARWQSSMDRELFRQVFGGSWTAIGEAIRAAKKVVGNPDVRRTWIYFGDPALRMKGMSRPPVETTPVVTPIAAPPVPDAGEGESQDHLGLNRRPAHLSVRLSDFDGNGRGDALIAQPSTGAWFAALGEVGGFRYVPGQFSVAGEPMALKLDSDGRADVFVYDAFTGAWLLGTTQSDGTFLTSTSGWSDSLDITSGDFDGDGLDDLFTHHPNGTWWQALSDGLGGFSYRSGSGLQMGTAYAADFNGDARSDVLVYNAASGAWTMMFSTAAGAPTVSQGTWTAGWQPIVANLNGDAAADLVLWHESSGAWVQCISDASQFFVYRAGSFPPGGRLHAANLVGDSRDDIMRYDWRTGSWSLATLDLSGNVTQWDGLWEAGWELTPGKLNGDALDDLLLYNPDTGEWVRRLNLPSGWVDEAYGLWSTDWTVAGQRKR